ncbi:MAG: hypothetical protein HC852_22410 [Acaryochloridaceae cyanobacterium RU_4_10]|nr:hypothetical protein [Acaryochloridaceae cyanobacterium RU_4_10]
MDSSIDKHTEVEKEEWIQASQHADVFPFAGKFIAYTVSGSRYIELNAGFRLRKRDIRYSYISRQTSTWSHGYGVGFGMSRFQRLAEIPSNCALTDNILASAEMFMRLATEDEVSALFDATQNDKAKLEYYSKLDTLKMLGTFLSNEYGG